MNPEEERRLKVSENLVKEEEQNPYPMTPEEVIERIRAARGKRAESGQQGSCGNGGCSSCSCGKKNNAEPV